MGDYLDRLEESLKFYIKGTVKIELTVLQVVGITIFHDFYYFRFIETDIDFSISPESMASKIVDIYINELVEKFVTNIELKST